MLKSLEKWSLAKPIANKIMSIVSNNIKYLRKKLHLTQEQLALKIGIKRSLVGAYEEGRADPRLNNLLKMSELFNVSVDSLISRDIARLDARDDQGGESETTTRILAVTVDPAGNENIELIPQRASAGYLNGYADPEYLEELPKFRLPFLPGNSSYRAFEISGDSMPPLENGTIIIGKYIESVTELKNDAAYILLTTTEGIVYKRVKTHLLEKDLLVLSSDNKNYPDYQVSGKEVLEIWEAVMYISKNLPQSPGPEKTGLDELKNMVMALQQEMIQLKKQ